MADGLENKEKRLIPILSKKIRDLCEMQIILFETCNLRCYFCNQDHLASTEVKNIDFMVDLVKETYRGQTYCDICVSGGELFMDQVSDANFEAYSELIQKIHAEIPHVRFSFPSNLVYENVERVKNFILSNREKGINLSLSPSYDPRGRFNPKTKKIFSRNIELLKDVISMVGVVITEQSAQWFIKDNKDPVFDYIYENFLVVFDYVTPWEGYEHLIPSTKTLADFFIKINQDYPNSIPIKDWRENHENAATCNVLTLITPVGITKCRSHIGKIENGECSREQNFWVDSVNKFVDRNNCLTCEYWSRCGLRCFRHNEFDKSVDECQYQRMFREILKD